MIKGIGIDCIKISRIDLRYVKYLSENELIMMKKFTSTNRKKEFCAGRWALKEAIFKAIPSIGKKFSQIDIFYNEQKQPSITLKNHKVWLSLSHEKDLAVAICVVE